MPKFTQAKKRPKKGWIKKNLLKISINHERDSLLKLKEVRMNK